MNKLSDLHAYQRRAIEFIHDKKKCALFVGLGLGKTITTLTALSQAMNSGEIKRVLIIAPLRVAKTTWEDELKKWEHLQYHTMNMAVGTAKQREKAVLTNSDFLTINVENVPWLVANYGGTLLSFDAIVFDESTLFKSFSSKRFKCLKKMIGLAQYKILLTGTPTPNGYLDLWSQIYLLDQGERLGEYITHYRTKYFNSDYLGYNYALKEGAKEVIKDKVNDLCLRLNTEDYLDLPDLIVSDHKIPLNTISVKYYKEFKKKLVLDLEKDVITSKNAASVVNKLSQFCNGSVYPDSSDDTDYARDIHSEKLDALQEIIDQNTNENMIVVYNFKSDKERIKRKFNNKVVLLDSEGHAQRRWNNGEIKVLLVHPASAAHGLNLQHGGNIIVWYGLTWNLEYYQQMNARLHRQGQEKPVRVIRLVATIEDEVTVDEKIAEGLEYKGQLQKDFLMSLVSG